MSFCDGVKRRSLSWFCFWGTLCVLMERDEASCPLGSVRPAELDGSSNSDSDAMEEGPFSFLTINSELCSALLPTTVGSESIQFRGMG